MVANGRAHLDIAATIQLQARVLFEHLPAGEISEGEPLHIKHNRRGVLVVLRDGDGAQYRMAGGCAIKLRPAGPGLLEMSAWENKKLILCTMIQSGTFAPIGKAA